jgi:hypothetical protein
MHRWNGDLDIYASQDVQYMCYENRLLYYVF